ncbi:MAG TPA: alpha-L-fucosidase [Clostridiales bacterium]|nr:alpha-L-fucosidase [Clostridiales bacterium]
MFKPTWKSLDSRVIPTWFQKAKFGIFIHWGVYSVPAWRKLSDERFGSYAEWYYASVYGNYKNNGDDFHERVYGKDYEYRNFAKNFKAELFDPDFWAETFKNAGAKYVVLTSKHHEGYCLWPTQNPHKKNWRVGDVGPKVDIVGELAKAVRSKGMRMGLYYSIVDWETNWSHRPDGGYFIPEKDRKKYGINEERYPDEILIPQLKELVQTYRPSVIYTDGGEWDFSEEYSQVKDFLAWLYNHAPNKEEVVINDRFCVGMPGNHGDYYSTEYKDVDGFGEIHPWEESRGVGGSYGFNRAESLENYNTSEQLIHELIEMVSNGGNFLLNVGPTSDGRIPVIQQQRLKDIGDWLRINGDAIYETAPSDYLFKNDDNIFMTQKDHSINVICTKWFDNKIELKKKKSFSVADISLFGYQGKVDYEVLDDRIRITPPCINPNNFKGQYAYVFNIKQA